MKFFNLKFSHLKTFKLKIFNLKIFNMKLFNMKRVQKTLIIQQFHRLVKSELISDVFRQFLSSLNI
jgi:hypothetical protein